MACTVLMADQTVPNRAKAARSIHAAACAGARRLTAFERRIAARDRRAAEGIGRDTVGRILSQQEVVEAIARYQSRLLDLVPKAIGVYDEALASDDLHLAAATATKLLEGLQVLHKGGIEQTIRVASLASPESNQKQRRLMMLGQILDGMLEKSRKYDLPLPPDVERLRDELERTDTPERNL